MDGFLIMGVYILMIVTSPIIMLISFIMLFKINSKIKRLDKLLQEVPTK